MKRFLSYISVLSYGFLLQSCASTPEAYTNFDNSANFATYRTFAWLPKDKQQCALAQNTIYDILLNNDLTEGSIKNQVNESLLTKGLTIDTDTPDVLLQYRVVIEKKEQIVNSPIVAGGDNSNYNLNTNSINSTDNQNYGNNSVNSNYTNTNNNNSVYNKITGNYTVYPYTYQYENNPISMYNTTMDGGSVYSPNTPLIVGSYIEKVDYSEGTLIIDAIDRKTNKLIWRGWNQEALTDPEVFDTELSAQVESIMAEFPTSGMLARNKK